MPDESWNQDNAWAEPDPRSETGEDGDWQEDLRSGSAYHMQGDAVSPPQSALGIASLVLSIMSGVMLAVGVMVATVAVAQNPNAPENDSQLLGAGCGMIVGLTLAVLAGIIGIAALFQPDRSRTCALLGVVLATLEVLGIAGLMVIGLLIAP